MENHLKGSNEKKKIEEQKKERTERRGWTQYWNGSRYTWCMQAFWIRFACIAFSPFQKKKKKINRRGSSSKKKRVNIEAHTPWHTRIDDGYVCFCYATALPQPYLTHRARCSFPCYFWWCVSVGTRITLLVVVVCSTILLISLQMKKVYEEKRSKAFFAFFSCSFQCGEKSILLKMVLLCF